MHSILFTIGPVTIYSYGVMLALAVLICAYFLTRDAKRYDISKDTAYDLIFWCMLWGIVGARIFYVWLEWPYFSANLLEIPMLQKGGLAWQGGFLGGALAGVWFTNSKKLALKPLLDWAAPYLALGQAIGRIGCFLNGCCYGKPVEWGIYCPLHGERLYPTQLFEAAALFAIFLILKKIQAGPHKAGFIFVLYLWLAAIERFAVEFFRGDHTVLWLGLSLAQYIALGVFTTGIILFVILSPAKGGTKNP